MLLLLAARGFAQVQSADLHNGDLLFQDLDCGPLCDAIEAVTTGYGGNSYSHMGMVVRRNDSLLVVEAAGTAVRLVPLAAFIQRTTKPLLVTRLKKQHQRLVPAALQFALQQLGTPYDQEYRYNNGAYYCSELMYDAFLHANHGHPFFRLEPMTYKEPGTNAFFPAWVDYYSQLGKPIPEGEPGCNPGGLSRSKKLQVMGTLQPATATP